jgi:transcriptional regulator with XRE-family HTH domain
MDWQDWKFEGSKILVARDVNDVTQTELAKMTGASQQQIAQWEAGEVVPGQDSLTKICNALKVPPRFFFVRCDNYVNVTDNSGQ